VDSRRAVRRELETRDSPSLADELLDDLIPPDLDWRGVVRRHPLPALLVAAGAGWWLGRSRRSAVLIEALTGAVAAGVVARFGSLVADEGDDAIGGLDHEPDAV
jgi:hypothetical protein